MTILGIDSSDEFLSVGVFRPKEVVISRSTGNEVKKNILHQFMMETLSLADIALSRIDGVAVAIGPGSFTGLRVGLAAAKGLCWAGQLPLAGVSSLLALAQCARGDSGSYLAVKDAKKNEYYYGGFSRVKGKISRILPDSIGSADDIGSLVAQGYGLLGSGVAVYRNKDAEPDSVPEVEYDNQALGGEVARIGHELIDIRETLDIEGSAPVYIRTPRYVISKA